LICQPELEGFMGRVVILIAALAAGCSSGPDNVCCIDFNGAQSYWTCPSAAAETACCDASGTSGAAGCISNPMDPAAAGCVDNASPSDCP
jgi:hypothetical protein